MASSTGLLSKGITLNFSTTVDGTYTNVPDLQSIPALGGKPEMVETTCLSDSSRKYVEGIKSYDSLEFDFLYDKGENSGYRVLNGLTAGQVYFWKVAFADGTEFAFTGSVSTAIQSAGINTAITFKATIALSSDISITLGELN